MNHKKHAPEDFKQQCVASCKHRGKRSLVELTLELGVGHSTLSKWVKDLNLKNEGRIVPIGDDAEKILRLQKENQQLKNENEFQKKNSAWAAPFTSPKKLLSSSRSNK